MNQARAITTAYAAVRAPLPMPAPTSFPAYTPLPTAASSARPVTPETRVASRASVSRSAGAVALVPATARAASVPTTASTILHAASMTDAEEESILALVITASSGAMQISEQSARLRQAADLLPDFADYSRLLRRSMKQAFELGKSEGKRRTGAANGTWRRIFKHFARRLGIAQDIEIFALDRAGSYDCRMTTKLTPDREWRKFVKQGRTYFIYPQELVVLAGKARLREERKLQRADGKNRKNALSGKE